MEGFEPKTSQLKTSEFSLRFTRIMIFLSKSCKAPVKGTEHLDWTTLNICSAKLSVV